MALLPVEQALERILAGVEPLGEETLKLEEAHGRILSATLSAQRTQPPFAVSAMDGFAVRAADGLQGAELARIGESSAGAAFKGRLQANQAVRIFTGALVPEGADAILIQENAIFEEGGQTLKVCTAAQKGQFIRPAGFDFKQGAALLSQGVRFGARELSIAASMDYPSVPVHRRPRIGILATGDELVHPGTRCKVDQIIASNTYGVAAYIRDAGGIPLDLGIAKDTQEDLAKKLDLAKQERVDVLVTLGGASVGQHDLVHSSFRAKGACFDFWKIAMRPGKPLMAGSFRDMKIIGLPGNPVSSLVCALLFVKPLVKKLSGYASWKTPLEEGVLGAEVGENDERQDYLRATLSKQGDPYRVFPMTGQDSSTLSVFLRSDCLMIRPPYAPPAKKGEKCQFLRLCS